MTPAEFQLVLVPCQCLLPRLSWREGRSSHCLPELVIHWSEELREGREVQQEGEDSNSDSMYGRPCGRCNEFLELQRRIRCPLPRPPNQSPSWVKEDYYTIFDENLRKQLFPSVFRKQQEGLHIMPIFFSDKLEEEIQIKGRIKGVLLINEILG
jgi:hypothetical protein